MKDLIVITGGPGCGKTTVLHELARRGYSTVPEVAREIIQQQVATGGEALPWANTAAYAALMLQRSISSYQQHQQATAPTFFDRGIPDTLGYLRLIQQDEALARLAAQQYRYADTVFLAPAWEAIYTQDTERKQTFEEAVQTAALLATVYTECGYNVIELPKTTPSNRADFILQHLHREEHTDN